MSEVKRFAALLLAMLLVTPIGGFAANHRSAPITALDHPAGITDWYAFVSYDDPSKVTMIMDVDPLLEPSNGPNYFPFDPGVVYIMKVDNTYDAVEDISFEFRFFTEIRAPQVPVAFIGAGAGINAPLNAPQAATTPGNAVATTSGPVIPPAITSLDGPGAAGLSLRQNYTVTLVQGTGATATRTDLTPASSKLFVVPANVGPRTMPCYASVPAVLPTGVSCTTPLAKQGIYTLNVPSSATVLGGSTGIRVWAGTADDPFFIDLGAAFDSLNFRAGAAFNGIAGILSATQDQADSLNFAADSLSGFNVNVIAIEVPRSLIVKSDAQPVIGTWAATYRPATTIRAAGSPLTTSGDLVQVNRMGNPLINELVIGTGSKDTFSLSQPKDDAQFANFGLDPTLARVFNTLYGVAVPDPPRKDLLILLQYQGPAVPAGTPTGPPADMLRLNTAIAATAQASRKRIGELAGDPAGFPNGRRLSDDVVDIAARAVAGAACGVPINAPAPGTSATAITCTSGGINFTGAQVPLIGDGVNANDVPTQETFPYVAFSQSGYTRVHHDPGEKACAQPAGCPTQ
jgi:uncharacterized protein DUF4331